MSFLVWSLLLSLTLIKDGEGAVSVKECKGSKIAILDLSDLSGVGNFPKCELDNAVQISPDDGRAYSRKEKIDGALPHVFSKLAGPWFLYEAIKSSEFYTEDLDEADVVFVYDYCYYMWWMGDVNSYGSEYTTESYSPGDHLFQAYDTLMQLPKWKWNNGGHFAFYDPFPDFMLGRARAPILGMKCTFFRKAIHLVAAKAMRNTCEAFWLIKRIIVTPYAPNLLEAKKPEAPMQQEFKSAEERPLLGYSRTSCALDSDRENVGKAMRYWFGYKEWGHVDELDVRCTNKELNPTGPVEFDDMYAKMRTAKFCPAFPGDTASSRLLSEIFMAGCIPIFLGPPYHSMPFGETVPYAELGMFFSIKDTSKWMDPGSAEFKLHPTIRAVSENEARWWVPDVEIPPTDIIKVEYPSELLAHIKGVPTGEINRKLRLVHEYGQRFAFLEKVSEPPNAVNSLLGGMCTKQRDFYRAEEEAAAGHLQR